jgi:opacity protein-like surface antigen
MRTIVRVLATCLLSLAMLTLPHLARAADTGPWNLPRPDDYRDPEGRVWHRTGPYVGLVAGANLAQFEAAGFDFNDTAWTGGALAGFQVKSGGLVWGVEGDFLLTNIKADFAAGTITASTDYLATIRAKLGVPIGPVMPFITGGAAFTRDKIVVAGVSSHEDKVGWAAGGGVDLELTRALTLRGEVIHYAFPDRDVGGLFDAKDQQTQARAAVVFKLN